MFIDGRFFRNDYTYDAKSNGWVKLHLMPETWNNARLRCFLEGSTLGSPLNDDILAVMKKLMGQNVKEIFTGVSATYSDGDFYTIEGISWENIQIPKFWAPGEPNNFGQENCIALDTKGLLADVSCLKALPFICFKKNSQNIPASNQCGTVDPDYIFEARTGHCYKIHRFGQSWSKAFMACSAEGGYLTVINNDIEAQALKELVAKYPGGKIQAKHRDIFGIGFHDWSQHGVFMTVHGISWENIQIPKFWAPGEPNNLGQENCIALDSKGLLADVSCLKALPFICFKKNSQNIPASNQCGTVDPDYIFEARTGHCYKIHRFGQSWSKAFMACSAEGGYLTVINNDIEAQALKELVAKYPGGKIQAKHRDIFGIGFHDWSQHGVFMTVHGQTLQEAGYDTWAGGQPDNASTGEYCGSMFRDARLNDIWCEDTTPFICEKLPGSLLDNESGSTDEVDELESTPNQ